VRGWVSGGHVVGVRRGGGGVDRVAAGGAGRARRVGRG
jgi:hypothetical protein